jgi:hypothetical protein
MTVSFSKEARYRNLTDTGEEPRGGRRVPPGPVLLGVAAVLVICCCCLGLVIGLQASNRTQALADKLGSSLPALPAFGGGPTVTPTPDKNAIVLPRKPGLADNGLELTVIGFQRPLKVQGTVPLPPDQQFVLATVRIRNTKKTGTPLKVTTADFIVKGDGGLTYNPNPKTVTIQNMLSELNIAPNATQEGELIFQIAADDSGLKLQWTAGTQKRIFQLEESTK